MTKMTDFETLFLTPKPVIGMIHLQALPGTPGNSANVDSIINKAVDEARIYKNCNIHSVMIENMHDVPYLNGVGPEIPAMMSVIGKAVKNETKLPCGLQILSGSNKEAIAAAYAAGLDFIRVEGFVFAHIGDEGLFESCAGELLRYRKNIGAEKIRIFTDIKKKHSSHSVTSDISITETAVAAEFFESDGVIITGRKTGDEAEVSEAGSVSEAVSIPVMIGSGITIENIDKYYEKADGFIVGSHFKKEGSWFNDPDPDRIKTFMEKFNSI